MINSELQQVCTSDISETFYFTKKLSFNNLDSSIQNAWVLRLIGMFNISVKISLMGNMLVNLLVSSPQPKCWWKQSNNEQKINLLLIFYCAHISNNLFMKKCCVRLVNPSWCNLWGYMCCALYWNGCTFLFLFFFSG